MRLDGVRSAVGSASDSRDKNPGFDTLSDQFLADSRTTDDSYWRKCVFCSG